MLGSESPYLSHPPTSHLYIESSSRTPGAGHPTHWGQKGPSSLPHKTVRATCFKVGVRGLRSGIPSSPHIPPTVGHSHPQLSSKHLKVDPAILSSPQGFLLKSHQGHSNDFWFLWQPWCSGLSSTSEMLLHSPLSPCLPQKKRKTNKQKTSLFHSSGHLLRKLTN